MNNIFKNQLNFTNGTYSTEIVKSTAEKVVLKASGAASDGVLYTIFTYDKNGTESVAVSNEIEIKDGRFNVDYPFDPLYLAVYHSAESFRVTISGAASLDDFSLVEESVISGNEHVSFSNILIENGVKKATVKRIDGTEITVPIVPKKALFMGNSLLLGMQYYGMCATDPENDYYFHVTNRLKEANPDCEFIKLHGVQFECNDTAEAFYDNLYKNPNRLTGRPLSEDLTEDIDLAIIQIGDNANNPARVEVFNKTCEDFIKYFKTACPNARIIWVYGWYNKGGIHKALMEACDTWKIESIDLSAMMPIKENQATKGQTYVKPDGSIEVAPDGWLSHPGNVGMYRIAKKMLEKIGI